ncbi:MAG TPA: hypothetical protein VMZ53_28530 [Kofleriaceae bacterium]|nr:hypothetical protein [Kofleriaceae bacterium]
MPRAGWLFVLVVVARGASAEPRRVAVDTPLEAFTPAATGTATYLYLNRCTGGCQIQGTGGSGVGVNDASANMTTIAASGTYTVGEYRDAMNQTGALADAEWAQLVKCMREVYSPYAVEVSDVRPSDGRAFNMAVIAGRPQEVGLGNDILGIAPLANDCSPQSNVISFSFANYHGSFGRVLNVCWTAAQETSHAYGLDHEYQFTTGESACSDPTTYRTDCGGQKFFRNRRAQCGEDGVRKCRCGSSQNSHAKLITVFGEGTPITAAPHVSLGFPTNGSTVGSSWVVHALAGSARGIAKVELYLNGSRWHVVPGQGFGANGQADPSDYTFMVSTKVPDGLIDVQAKAYDDLGIASDSEIVTVTKGAACTMDAQCLADQHCQAGHCTWPAPEGELGASCEYDQQCKGWTCLGDEDSKYCTVPCYTDEPTSCPSDFTCAPTGNQTDGFCLPEGGGCCSASGDGGRGLWATACLSVLVLTWLRRRRR